MLSQKLRLSLLLDSKNAGDAESEAEVESTFRFKETDVLKALLHLNPNKACGTD